MINLHVYLYSFLCVLYDMHYAYNIKGLLNLETSADINPYPTENNAIYIFSQANTNTTCI